MRASSRQRSGTSSAWRAGGYRPHDSVTPALYYAAVRMGSGYSARCGVRMVTMRAAASTLSTCQVGSISNHRAAKLGLAPYLWWFVLNHSPLDGTLTGGR